jgi:hypothetical protein
VAETWKVYTPEICELKLQNVVVGGTPGQPVSPNLIRVTGRPTRLTLDHATLYGMSIQAEKWALLAVHDSVVAGGSSATIDVQPDVIWQADRNVYDVGSIRTGGTLYAAKDFAALQKSTRQDHASRFNHIQFRQPFDGLIDSLRIEPSIGADLSRLPRP